MFRIEQIFTPHSMQDEMDAGMVADCLQSCMECLETYNS